VTVSGEAAAAPKRKAMIDDDDAIRASLRPARVA
jgi:hypothetical protein